MNATVGFLLLGLFLAAAVRYLWRLRSTTRTEPLEVDDDVIRRIERDGRLSTECDEPLDLREIQRREEEFWDEERWDEADPW